MSEHLGEMEGKERVCGFDGCVGMAAGATEKVGAIGWLDLSVFFYSLT